MDMNTTEFENPGGQSHTNSTCSRDNVLKTVVFPVLYSCLLLVGISLNSVAVWVFFRIPSRSHFIIYLKNIVVADVVMTFTFPFKVCYSSNFKSWSCSKGNKLFFFFFFVFAINDLIKVSNTCFWLWILFNNKFKMMDFTFLWFHN